MEDNYNSTDNSKNSYDFAIKKMRIKKMATRIERIGDATLYLGDCLEILPCLDKVDAVVTSPPYDNLRKYGESFNGIDLFSVISSLSEKITVGGVCVWNVADATINGSETGSSFRQALHALDCGLRLHDTMIYIKDNVNFPEDVRYFSGHEYMFVFSNGAPKTFNPIKDRPNKWAGTVMHGTDRQIDGSVKKISGKGKEIKPFGMRFNWRHLKNNTHDCEGHPAPMPYAMAHGQITTWTNADDVVLDPFMGSGTTGIACAKLGRNFIGIDIEEKYFNISCKRIDDAYKQGDMFIKKDAPAEQLKLIG